MKLAFIGTGKIIGDALFAVEPVETIERTAIFARPHSRKKAEDLAAQYQIPEIYTDYGQLLEETAADTVYIGLINSAHYPYAKEALLHGKNVILEKPFTGFYEEAKELQQIAEEKKLFIFEAITILHNDWEHSGWLCAIILSIPAGMTLTWREISLILLTRNIMAERCMILMFITSITVWACLESRWMWNIIRI